MRTCWRRIVTGSGIGIVLLLGSGTVVANDAFPRDAAAAEQLYESDLARWIDGPVAYIALPEEIAAFRALSDEPARARFVRWFWARRDDDRRDEHNPYRERFYQRVAEANARFSEFPRGWRSDRGRVYITLGRPDAIRPEFGPTAEASIWVYYTVGPRAEQRGFGSSLGELSVAFVRVQSRAGYQIYGGFGGPGILPRYVRDAMRFANEGAIVDPFLTIDAIS